MTDHSIPSEVQRLLNEVGIDPFGTLPMEPTPIVHNAPQEEISWPAGTGPLVSMFDESYPRCIVTGGSHNPQPAFEPPVHRFERYEHGGETYTIYVPEPLEQPFMKDFMEQGVPVRPEMDDLLKRIIPINPLRG